MSSTTANNLSVTVWSCNPSAGEAKTGESHHKHTHTHNLAEALLRLGPRSHLGFSNSSFHQSGCSHGATSFCGIQIRKATRCPQKGEHSL